MSDAGEAKAREIWSYVIGYGLALVLTGAAFAVVHFGFFLHIRLGKSSRDDLMLILFSAAIIILMVSGTLVILFNLRQRMM